MGVQIPWLVDAARMAVAGTGKQVIVSPNWLTRGQGLLRGVFVIVGHHTATPASAPGDYPSRNVVENGRAGLVGLLSQLGLGRSGNVYVMGGEIAYHAGASRYLDFIDLNDESIGIEAESPGDGSWTTDQLLIYPRLVGALLTYTRLDLIRYASHRTVAVPAGRKPDPTGISDDWMRLKAAQFLAGQGESMGSADAAFDMAAKRLRESTNPDLRAKVPGDFALIDNALNVIALRAELAAFRTVMIAAVAQLADAIKIGEANDLTVEKMRAELEAALENTVIDVDVILGPRAELEAAQVQRGETK